MVSERSPPTSTRSRRSVDWRQQNQVAAGIGDGSAADGQSEAIVVEPQTVVEHESEKILRRLPGRAARAAHAATGFTAGVDRQGNGRLAEQRARVVVVL